jgi:hypothetical protein
VIALIESAQVCSSKVLDLRPYFSPAPGSTITPQNHIVDTGSKSHDITHYLTKGTAGRIVTETLAGL